MEHKKCYLQKYLRRFETFHSEQKILPWQTMRTFIFSRIAWYNLDFPCIYNGSSHFPQNPISIYLSILFLILVGKSCTNGCKFYHSYSSPIFSPSFIPHSLFSILSWHSPYPPMPYMPFMNMWCCFIKMQSPVQYMNMGTIPSVKFLEIFCTDLCKHISRHRTVHVSKL